MGGINSRAKGSKNERMVCKWFEDWTGHKFARTPASGGLHWGLSQACGDLICLSEKHKFPFSIETKSYNKIDFSHLLLDRQSDLIAFWEQCLEDSIEAKKIPFLFVRYNGLPKNFYFCFLKIKIWQKIPRTIKAPITKTLKFIGKKHRLIVIRSDELLKTDYKALKRFLDETPKEFKY